MSDFLNWHTLMKRSLAASFSLLLLTTSCVPFASSVDPIYVSSLTYDRWDCGKLEAENTRLSSEVTRLEGLQNSNASADVAMTTVGVLVAWPILFGLAATHDHRVELATAKGQLAAATQARGGDQCLAGPGRRELLAVAPAPAFSEPTFAYKTALAAVRPVTFSSPLVERPASTVPELIVARNTYRSCLINAQKRPAYSSILMRLGNVRTGEVDERSASDQFPTTKESALLEDYWNTTYACRAEFEASSRVSSPAVANALQKFNERTGSAVNLLIVRQISWAGAAREQNGAQQTLKSELQAITF